MGQPFAGHHPAIAQLVERLIVDSADRLQVQHDHRGLGALHDGQYRRAQRVSRDIKQDEVDRFTSQFVSDVTRTHWVVNNTGIDEVHIRSQLSQPVCNLSLVSPQAFEQSFKLTPVGI